MQFGPVATAQAAGAILAHSLKAGRSVLKKGKLLTTEDVTRLQAAGFGTITVARLAKGDLDENAAAMALARALVPNPGAVGLRVSKASAGRVNIHSRHGGLVRLDVPSIQRVNRVDALITLATLADLAWVSKDTLVATVKIISYGVPGTHIVDASVDIAGALRMLPVVRRSASLVLTHTPGMKPSLLSKGRLAVVKRLTALGINLSDSQTVDHTEAALAGAIAQAGGEMVLILTGSATSDVRDVGPMALRAAGGCLTRFGLPVDPGNLLFLGAFKDRPVIGLPGCARSLALNGADWVLERIACGLTVTNADMAAMAVGGLLKETRARPQPREG